MAKLGGRGSKQKGNRWERELVNLARESGLEAKRAYASNGQSLGHHEEVDVLIESKRIQAKRRKALAVWAKPNENVDATAIKEDRGVPMVVITLWEYFDLLKAVDLAAHRNPETTAPTTSSVLRS